MTRRNYQHAGPRRRSWWRGPALPVTLLALALVGLGWELSWALPILGGG